MIKADEKILLVELLRRGEYQALDEFGRGIRDVATGKDIPEKRACYLFEKWYDRGWYEYGVNIGLGWLTPEGAIAIRALLGLEA